jgi:TadE-like protein
VITLPLRRGRRRSRGQALVEFSIAVIPFLLLLMGVLDLGRAIYAMNATAEGAREIARVTSVHRNGNGSTDLGSSTEARAVIDTQRSTIPSLVFDPVADIDCVERTPPTESVKDDTTCITGSGDDFFIRVHVVSTFTPITPLVGMFGSHTLESWARIGLK